MARRTKQPTPEAPKKTRRTSTAQEPRTLKRQFTPTAQNRELVTSEAYADLPAGEKILLPVLLALTDFNTGIVRHGGLKNLARLCGTGLGKPHAVSAALWGLAEHTGLKVWRRQVRGFHHVLEVRWPLAHPLKLAENPQVRQTEDITQAQPTGTPNGGRAGTPNGGHTLSSTLRINLGRKAPVEVFLHLENRKVKEHWTEEQSQGAELWRVYDRWDADEMERRVDGVLLGQFNRWMVAWGEMLRINHGAAMHALEATEAKLRKRGEFNRELGLEPYAWTCFNRYLSKRGRSETLTEEETGIRQRDRSATLLLRLAPKVSELQELTRDTVDDDGKRQQPFIAAEDAWADLVRTLDICGVDSGYYTITWPDVLHGRALLPEDTLQDLLKQVDAGLQACREEAKRRAR